MPLDAIGSAMSWGEALRLTEKLAADTSSHIHAAIAGWAYPISLEALFLLDLFDRLGQVHSSKAPKPHPGRPFRRAGDTKRRGKPRPRSEAVAILNRFGHSLPV